MCHRDSDSSLLTWLSAKTLQVCFVWIRWNEPCVVSPTLFQCWGWGMCFNAPSGTQRTSSYLHVCPDLQMCSSFRLESWKTASMIPVRRRGTRVSITLCSATWKKKQQWNGEFQWNIFFILRHVFWWTVSKQWKGDNMQQSNSQNKTRKFTWHAQQSNRSSVLFGGSGDSWRHNISNREEKVR